MKRLNGMMTSHSSEWRTPDCVFQGLHAEFRFDLDPCSTHANAKCKRHFTKEEDGLAQAWTCSVFINPPYGRDIGPWVKKAFESARAGATCVLLLPARTDTRWWNQFCRHGEVRFMQGRLRFGDGKGSAPFPSAVVIFRGNPLNAVHAAATHMDVK